jgi:hypothetical protein
MKIPYDGRRLENVIYEGNKIHGEGNINYKHIVSDAILKCKVEFKLECAKCNFVWITTTISFITNKNGCPWCKNEAKELKKFPLFMIEEMGDRNHDKNYIYSNNDPNKIYKKSDFIKIWCGNEEHEIFEEKLGIHLSRSKRSSCRSKGCSKCNLNKIEVEKIIWKENLEALKRKGEERHGKERYDYDLNKIEDLKNVTSKIKIVCNECDNIFLKSIRDHIHSKIGCPECYDRKKITVKSFLEKANTMYPNGEYLYHRIKEEDIINKKSKLKIECSKCGFILQNTKIVDFLLKKRGCDRCNNREKWNSEKLYLKCEERKKEGVYSYEYVNFNKNYTKKIK